MLRLRAYYGLGPIWARARLGDAENKSKDSVAATRRVRLAQRYPALKGRAKLIPPLRGEEQRSRRIKFGTSSHRLRDAGSIASPRKELCRCPSTIHASGNRIFREPGECQAGAASGTTAPTPGRPYRAYPLFTNEAHFRITDSSHNFFPFFPTFYATVGGIAAREVLGRQARKGRAFPQGRRRSRKRMSKLQGRRSHQRVVGSVRR